MGRDEATYIVLMLGYPGVGKRTTGAALAELLDAVLVDNSLINVPLLTLFRWDGVFPLPGEIWQRVKPIREAVLGTIEDLAPATNSYVFTNVLEDDEDGAADYATLRALAQRRGSLFLAVMLECNLDEQISRIDAPDRLARLKGADPEGYRGYTQQTRLFQPPPAETIRVDSTRTSAERNAQIIHEALLDRGRPTSA